ncbi:MAG: hemolysin III family protein [Flavobacteriaceae bacterium]|nr:hemolysin III family protein [Flavobacteriaceae bacterium]
MKPKPINFYNPLEEKINVITHAVGIVISIAALVLLVMFASFYGNVWHIVSFSIYGASLIALYTASTIYHSIQDPKWRYRFNIVDHSAIYILIAGTYTPFALVTLNGTVGWVLFGVTWGIAAIGIIFKIFFTGRFDIISTIAYVAMGWIVIFAINPLMDNLPINGIFWLFLGGIFYTIGAIIYAIKRIKFNHAIFHVFVLLGSISHFFAVFFYVLP